MKQRRIKKLVKKFINAIDNEGAQDVLNRVDTINAMNASQLKTALLNVDEDIIGGTAVPNKADAFPNDARETVATADGIGQNKAIHDAAIVIADKRADVGTAEAGLFFDITEGAKAGGTVATALAAVPAVVPADNGPDNGFADYETKYNTAKTALTTLEGLVGNYEDIRDEALAVWNTIKDFTPTASVKYGTPGVLVTASFDAAKLDIAELTNNDGGLVDPVPAEAEVFDLSNETDLIGADDANGDGTLRATFNALTDPTTIPAPEPPAENP